MSSLKTDIVENKLISIILDYCKILEMDIPEKVNADFVPGKYIKSHVLLTAISDISLVLDIEIPNNCYIFFDSALRKQLSIKETVQKILRVAINAK
jgi:hypothetical protein